MYRIYTYQQIVCVNSNGSSNHFLLGSAIFTSMNKIRNQALPVEVQVYADTDHASLEQLLQRFQITLELTNDSNIPGSFWGDSEAGLIGSRIICRNDTPLHSILHEACHYICMDSERRQGLHTNAGGDYAEENGVCYLQILLADEITGCNRQRMWQDMDTWGYTFRLGSARAWFEEDAQDAREWLRQYQIIDYNNQPSFRLRQ